MRCGMRKPRSLKVKCYATSFIDLNEYLAVLPGEKIIDKTCMMEQNDFSKKSTPNRWRKQAYVLGFDCENIT